MEPGVCGVSGAHLGEISEVIMGKGKWRHLSRSKAHTKDARLHLFPSPPKWTFVCTTRIIIIIHNPFYFIKTLRRRHAISPEAWFISLLAIRQLIIDNDPHENRHWVSLCVHVAERGKTINSKLRWSAITIRPDDVVHIFW